MVVDDQQMAAGRPLAQAGDKTFGGLGAGGAGAVAAGGVDALPEGGVIGQMGQLSSITLFGLPQPLVDQGQLIGAVFLPLPAEKQPLAASGQELVPAVKTEVVGPPFNAEGLEPGGQVAADKGDLLG